MKVLITGSGGQVGRTLLDTAPAGFEPTGFSRHRLDITDRASIERAVENEAPAVVINAAAYTAVDRAESDKEQAFAINGAAVAALADVCASHDVRLVHLSTDFVFDGRQSHPYRPQDGTSPQNIYGRSKLQGETAALADSGNLVVRTAWVYGNSGRNFVKSLLLLLSERDEVRIVADQVGTPTNARSLAGAIWALVRHDARGLFHFTDAGVASWFDFAVAIQEESLELGLLKREVPIIPISTADYPSPAKRPAYSVLDKSACWAAIGHPARHWRAELREMLTIEKESRG